MDKEQLAQLVQSLDEILQSDSEQALSGVGDPTQEALVRIGCGAKMLGYGLAQLLVYGDASATMPPLRAAMRAGTEQALFPLAPSRQAGHLQAQVRVAMERFADYLVHAAEETAAFPGQVA